jgi:hypothetical protein
MFGEVAAMPRRAELEAQWPGFSQRIVAFCFMFEKCLFYILKLMQFCLTVYSGDPPGWQSDIFST